MKFKISVLLTALLSVGLVACNDNNDNNNKSEQIEPTPETIKLSVLGHYKTNIFAESAEKFLRMMRQANGYLS